MRKKLLSSILIVTMILSFIGCGASEDTSKPENDDPATSVTAVLEAESDELIIDFADATCFEAALNKGEDCTGKIVQFVADELHPDSAAGYDIWAGKHLNFISNGDPGIEEGSTVTVRIIKAESSMQSWFLSYEIVENAVIGATTVSTGDGSGTSSFGINGNTYEELPLELVDYGWFANKSGGDDVFIDFCGMIHNPNEELIAEFPKIYVTVKNGNGNILATEEQVGSVVMPGDTITLCGMFSMLTTQLTDDATITFDVDCSELGYSSSIYSQAKTTDFAITNVSEQNGSSENFITGEITNNYSEEVDQINLAIVLRKDGEIVFMENTFIDGLKPGQTKAFQIQRYEKWPDHDTIDCSAMTW